MRRADGSASAATWHTLRSKRWPAFGLVIGGLLMAIIRSALTTVRGPTSANMERPLLGLTPFFLGTLPGGPTDRLPAGGLRMRYPVLAARSDRWGRLGYGMTCIATVASAIVGLSIGALGPPFTVPEIGPDLILLARAGGTCPSCACETERR